MGKMVWLSLHLRCLSAIKEMKTVRALGLGSIRPLLVQDFARATEQSVKLLKKSVKLF